jgi:multidrug resistance efflux pump
MTFLNMLSGHSSQDQSAHCRVDNTPQQQVNLASATLIVTLTSILALPLLTYRAEALPLDSTEQQRLGVEFSTLTTQAQLPLAVLPGSTAVSDHQRLQLIMPFETRIEQWLQPSGQHLNAGQPLLQLHSHEIQAFIQNHQRQQQTARLCQQRLTNLQDRQRSGLSTRLDIEEKSLECQQLSDSVSSNQQVLTHLPSAWLNTHDAEFTLNSRSSGWLIRLNQQTGQIASPGTSLAEFWPDSALAILVEVPIRLAQQLQPGQSLAVRPVGSDDPSVTDTHTATVQRIEQGISITGQQQVWLQLQTGQPVPGQRWQVTIPSAQSGWAIPASARVRAQGQSWVFLQQHHEIKPLAVKPIAEGGGYLLIPAATLPRQPTLATRGTAALMSYWQASSEEDK